MRRTLSAGLLTVALTLMVAAGISWATMKHHGGSKISSVKDGVKATLMLSPNMVDLLLADAGTGRTLRGAKVKAVITLPDGQKIEKELLGMKMGDVFSYMNSLDTSHKGRYHFAIVVAIDGKQIKFDFSYQMK